MILTFLWIWTWTTSFGCSRLDLKISFSAANSLLFDNILWQKIGYFYVFLDVTVTSWPWLNAAELCSFRAPSIRSSMLLGSLMSHQAQHPRLHHAFSGREQSNLVRQLWPKTLPHRDTLSVARKMQNVQKDVMLQIHARNDLFVYRENIYYSVEEYSFLNLIPI